MIKDVTPAYDISLCIFRQHREKKGTEQYIGDPAMIESALGDNFGSSTSRKNVISHTTAENLSSKHQVMLTPIKHEDIESNVLNDAYLFGSQLGVSVEETAALIPPNLRVNSSRKSSRPTNNDKVSQQASSSKHNSVSSGHVGTEKYKDASPRPDIRLPADLEKTMLAAQGKLAYVSPTVRQSNNVNRHTFHGSTSQSQKQSASMSNLGFVTRQAGGSMSQLSPAQPQLQLGQPTVLLNAGSQVDLHR